MGWKTNGERVLVRPADDKDNVTESGLIVMSEQKEKPNVGIVVEGFGDFPSGTTVMYARYGGQDVKINDVPHVVLDVSDILLVYVHEELQDD